METPTIPRPELTRYLVPAGELEYPEYAYRIRARNDAERKHLYQLISALLNSSGGVIEIDPGMPLDSKEFDEWQNRLKDQLLKFMPKVIYQQCISLREEELKLFMLIRKSTVFITTKSHMHTRGAAPATTDTEQWSEISAVLTQTVVEGFPTVFPQNIRHMYNDCCSVTESQNVEFKSFNCSTVDELIQRLHDPRTLKSLLVMGNVIGGGEIIIGVKEHPSRQGHIIVGQELDVSEEADFKQKLAQLLTKDVDGTNRIWGDPSVVPSEGTHWECDILHLGSPPYRCHTPCSGCPHRKRRCLICIRIAQVCGGVYAKPPESFLINDDGEVHLNKFNEWREKHQLKAPSGSQMQQILQEKPIISVTKPAAKKTSRASAHVSGTFKDDMKISFREQSSHAELLRFKSEYSDHHIRKSRIFDMTRPLHMTPPADDIEKCIDSPAASSQSIMELVNSEQGNQEGFGLADRSLHNCMEHDLRISTPRDHILDLYTFTATAKAILFIICANFSANKRDLIGYGMILGRILKQRILQNLSPCDRMPSLDFSCLFLDLSCRKCHIVSPSFYNEWLKNTCEPAGIISALGRVLTKVQTHFSDAVRLAAVTSLSQEQTYIWLAIARNRLNVIEGPPGCGKTLLAQHVCENKGFEKAAYISASVGLNNRVKASGKVDAFLAVNSDDIVSLLCSELEHKTYIIIDDNHCYQHSDETIAKICRQITTTNKYLYVFQDSKFQNYQHHKSSQFLRHLSRNNYSSCAFRTMTEIQRNSQVVGSFLKAQARTLPQGDSIKCVSEIEGNDIQIQHVRKLRAPGPDNGLLTHIRSLISSPFTPGQWDCSYHDIAVLVDDSQGPEEVAMFTEVLKRHLPDSNVQSADVCPVEGIIVDLLENFSGLESKVVVFIMPKSSQTSEKHDQAKLTKQMIAVASRGIHRVDILREDNLDKELADRVKIDLYPDGTWKQIVQTTQAPVLVWRTKDKTYVQDVCWEREGEDAALLYVTSSSVVRVSVTGEPLPISMDTSHKHNLESVTCSPDGEWAVVMHYSVTGYWTAYHREAPGIYRRERTHTTDGHFHSVRFTPQGHLAVLVQITNGLTCVQLYRDVSDSDLLWEQRVPCIANIAPGGLVVSLTGNILLCEKLGVTEYSVTDGSRLSTVPYPADMKHPRSVCADPSGRVWVGCLGKSVWLCGGGRGRKVIDTGDTLVRSLVLRSHRLAVATYGEGLLFYAV